MSKILHLMFNSLNEIIPSSAILMFHHITSSPKIKRSECMLNTSGFYNFIQCFNNYSSLGSVIAHPQLKKIAITFDDGLEDLCSIAYPYLKEKGIPFTAFIAVDFLDKPGYISTKQLLELSRDKMVTIGSHGISHASLPNLSTEEKYREIVKSKEVLSEIIGRPIDYFAYSHGLYDDECIKFASAYQNGFTVYNRPINHIIKYQKYILPRYNVENPNYITVLDNVNKLFRR